MAGRKSRGWYTQDVRRSLTCLIGGLFIAASVAFARGAEPAGGKSGEADVRGSIARSLPFLEAKGVAWIAERGCVSCHQTAFLVWTHNDARRRGFAVNADKLDAWNGWAVINVLTAAQNGTRQGAETLSQVLLSRDAQSLLVRKPTTSTRTVEPYENIVKDLLACQTPDGNWTAAGQSRNPPDVPTGWALVALAAREREGNDADAAPDLAKLVKANSEAAAKATAKALQWLERSAEDPTKDLTEQLVVRLLVQSTLPDRARTDGRLRDLLARQNGDGGWAVDPKLGKGSDAFATGMALYAIASLMPATTGTSAGTSRPAVNDAAVAKARAYLRNTQQNDGSWKIPTSSFHPVTGKPRDARTDDVYSYWGTGWATLGLLHTLPAPAASGQ
jgi:hypothetical protein